MASPFPGMDPYLETPACWADFHHVFVNYWREAVGDALPDTYDARLNESVNLVQMAPEVIKLIYLDVAVNSGEGKGKRAKSKGMPALMLEPETIPHESLDEVPQAWIEILRLPERELIAVLELLSPFNKSGEGFGQYRAKRKAILQQKVHLVELDLLVGGKRLPLSRPLPDADYYALISRAQDRPDCDVYRWKLRDPLPTIPIPLRAPDADINIDLAEVFKIAYERGRYARVLSYGKQVPAPLSAADARWARALSKKKANGKA